MYVLSYVEPVSGTTCLREAASAEAGNDAGRASSRHPFSRWEVRSGRKDDSARESSLAWTV